MTLTSVQAADLLEDGKGEKKKRELGNCEVSAVLGLLDFIAH